MFLSFASSHRTTRRSTIHVVPRVVRFLPKFLSLFTHVFFLPLSFAAILLQFLPLSHTGRGRSTKRSVRRESLADVGDDSGCGKYTGQFGTKGNFLKQGL